MNSPRLLDALTLGAGFALAAHLAPFALGQRIAARRAVRSGLWAAVGSLALLYVLALL